MPELKRFAQQIAAAANLDPMQASWIMHSNTYMALTTMRAAGVPVFPETGSGLLMGIPVLTPTQEPADDVGLLHGASLYRSYDLDAADIGIRNDAAIHMSDAAVVDCFSVAEARVSLQKGSGALDGHDFICPTETPR